MKNLQKSAIRVTALAAALFVISCRVALAPAYDAAIIEKTNAATTNLLTLFAETATGVDQETFPVRAARYHELIGTFDALSIQAKARPVPENRILDKINQSLKDKGLEAVSGHYPSAVAFEEIAKTLQKMKELDQNSGLKPGLVAAFKGQVTLFLDQAMTYESFLKR